jgi:hypothetical protein
MAGFADMGAGLGGLYSTLLGDFLTRGDRKKQEEDMAREREVYQGLPTNLVADREQTYELGPSAYDALSEDPLLRGEQLRSLASLRDIADKGGLDISSRAALAEAQAATAGQERATRGNILDQFARGGGGAGNQALLASLVAQQGAAQRGGMEGLRAAADANTRRYGALRDAASLAGDVRGADYQVLGDKASAADRIAAYNAANRQRVAGSNVDRENRFREGNADREYRRAGMVGGTYGNERDWHAQQETRKRGLITGVGSGVGRNIGGGMDLLTGGVGPAGGTAASPQGYAYGPYDPKKPRPY